MNDRRSGRRSGTRAPLRTVFAVVEGASEKIYLERLRRLNTGISVRIRVTNQKKAVDIVSECLRLSEREHTLPSDARVVIFDSDAVSEEDMIEAKALASKNGIIIATSNLCFEYWLLLHLEEPPMRLDRYDLYADELTGLLGRTYVKSKGLGDAITPKSVSDAIARAKKRLPSGDPADCHRKLNSTCMHNVAGILLSGKRD